jgi:hypothetical protein
VTTYRTGTHHGITICAENDGARCGRPDHDCARGHLVAVVVEGADGLDAVEFAERICALLNGDQPPRRGCICNDPPPTTTGKNQPATRPPGWACPRHGEVI